MPAPSLAIDFGTTRTKVAYYDANRCEPRLIEIGREIRAIVPSTFYVPLDGHGDRQVGDDAQDQSETDPQGVVIGLKKEIHRLGKKHFGPGRQGVSRVDLASDLFGMIRRICREEVFHSDVTSCTLTVPVTFEEQKRECIRKAAELGGFREIRVVEEPVSAAQAWLVQAGQKFGNHVIVCDVGGGTTDLALLRYADRRFEQVPEVPTAGFAMGGNDVDESIFDQLLGLQDKEFDHGLAVHQKTGFLIKLRKLRELLPRDQRREFVIASASATMKVSRDVLEQCTSEFIDRVKDEIRRFLVRCHQSGDVGESPLLLVGGASRLPGLKESLETIAPGHVYFWNQSDYATVLGAVEQPAIKVRPQTHKTGSVKPESSTTPRYTRGRIREMVGDGQCEQAMEIVAKALAANPTDDVFDLWLEVSAVVPEASRVLSRARDIHRSRHGDVWSTAALACALVDANRRDEAKSLLGPSSPRTDDTCYPLQMAWLSLLSNDPKNSNYRRLLDHLLVARPKNALLLVRRSEELMENDPVQAGEVLQRAINIDPNCIAAILIRALMPIGIATDQETAIAAIRSDLAVMERIAKNHYVARILRALYRFETSDFQGAKSELDLAIQDTRLMADPEAIAGMLILRARANIAFNDVVTARRDVNEALRYAPNCLEAIFLSGAFLQEDNDWHGSYACYDRGLDLSPASFEGLVGRAWALVGLGRYQEAAQDFETAAKLQPENVEAAGLATYGTILVLLGNEHEQVKQLDGSLFIWPNIPEDKITTAKLNLGTLPPGDNTILLLYDATPLSTLGYGFYITERHVVAKQEPVQWFSETYTITFQLSQIPESALGVRSIILKTDPKFSQLLPMPDGPFWKGEKMRMIMRDLIERLAALHRRIS